MSKNLTILWLIFSILFQFSVSGVGPPEVFYSLSSPEVSGPYNPGDTVIVSWNNVRDVACKKNPVWINIEYFDETDGISLEAISYPFTADRESDNSHVVGYEEAGDTVKVYIYFADASSAKHGDPGIYCGIFDTYTVEPFQPPPPNTKWCEKESKEIPEDEWTKKRCEISPPPPSKPRMVILANSIDYGLASDFFGFLRNEGMEVIHSNAQDFEQYKTEKFIVILGGPDAYDGVDEIVETILDDNEKAEVRTEGNRKMYVKPNAFTPGQVIYVIAGSDRYQTQLAHQENKDEVALEARI